MAKSQKKSSPSCHGFLQGQENDNISYFQIHTEAPLHSTNIVETFPTFSFIFGSPILDSSSKLLMVVSPKIVPSKCSITGALQTPTSLLVSRAEDM